MESVSECHVQARLQADVKNEAVEVSVHERRRERGRERKIPIRLSMCCLRDNTERKWQVFDGVSQWVVLPVGCYMCLSACLHYVPNMRVLLLGEKAKIKNSYL